MRTSATHKAEGATPTPFQKPTLASLGCPPITISPSPGGFQAMVYEAICPRFDSWLGDSFARTFLSHAFVLADSRHEPPKLVGSGSTPDGGAAFVHSRRAYTHWKSPSGLWFKPKRRSAHSDETHSIIAAWGNSTPRGS